MEQRDPPLHSATRRGSRKAFGPAQDVLVCRLPDKQPLALFLRTVGERCVCIERSIDRELVYFTGEVSEETRARLKICEHRGFHPELRTSSVLLLSIKGKQSLALDEALEIVRASPLAVAMQLIKFVAVKRAKKTSQPAVSAHALIQVRDRACANALLHSIDAQPYKGFAVHSPQLSLHALSLGNNHDVWFNPGYDRRAPAEPLLKKVAATTLANALQQPGSSDGSQQEQQQQRREASSNESGEWQSQTVTSSGTPLQMTPVSAQQGQPVFVQFSGGYPQAVQSGAVPQLAVAPTFVRQQVPQVPQMVSVQQPYQIVSLQPQMFQQPMHTFSTFQLPMEAAQQQPGAYMFVGRLMH